jgi:hypothetical protein
MTKMDRATVQELLDATEAGDYGPVFETFAENIIVENGPGVGAWRHAEGRNEFAQVLRGFSAFFNGTFRQRGRCIYADHADDKVDRLWTVDLDTEACLGFWARNPVETAMSPSGEQADPLR